jgi:hypothetical protein
MSYAHGARVLYADKPGRVLEVVRHAAAPEGVLYYRVVLDNGARVCPAFDDELQPEPSPRVAKLEARAIRSQQTLAAILRRAETLRRYPTDYTHVDAIIALCRLALRPDLGGSAGTAARSQNSEVKHGSA